jgi:hypothetical protein
VQGDRGPFLFKQAADSIAAWAPPLAIAIAIPPVIFPDRTSLYRAKRFATRKLAEGGNALVLNRSGSRRALHPPTIFNPLGASRPWATGVASIRAQPARLSAGVESRLHCHLLSNAPSESII